MTNYAPLREQALYKRVFGAGAHIEWAEVRKYVADASHTTEQWLLLLGLLDFVSEVSNSFPKSYTPQSHHCPPPLVPPFVSAP